MIEAPSVKELWYRKKLRLNLAVPYCAVTPTAHLCLEGSWSHQLRSLVQPLAQVTIPDLKAFNFQVFLYHLPGC